MAVTRLLRIRESAGANPAAHLKRNIAYICNGEKTQNGIFIGGNAGQTPDMIYRNMMENKHLWGKTDGSQAFHYMLSFHPDCKVDEALAFQIAEEFCQELLQDQYLYVFAVHNDKSHMHVHITFDSVSRSDGRKFHSPRGDWQRRIQPITDRLCEKYHLPALAYEEEKRGRNYGEWKAETKTDHQQNYTWNDIIRDDIDEAIRNSDTYEEFLSGLRKDGYTVTRDGKYLSLRPARRERATRTARLGEGYTKEEIQKRIADKKLQPGIRQRMKTYGDREEVWNIIYMKIKRTPGWKMTPMQRTFWKRWNDTFFIRKPERMTQEQRIRRKQDILEIRTLSAATAYLIDHDIGDPDELGRRKALLAREEEALTQEYSVCRTRYYKKQPFYLLSQYDRKKAEYDADPSLDKKAELDQLMEKIEAVCPYEEAVFQREEIKKQMETLLALKKDNRKEQRITEEISRLFDKMEPERKALAENDQNQERKAEKETAEEVDRKRKTGNQGRIRRGGETENGTE